MVVNGANVLLDCVKKAWKFDQRTINKLNYSILIQNFIIYKTIGDVHAQLNTVSHTYIEKFGSTWFV